MCPVVRWFGFLMAPKNWTFFIRFLNGQPNHVAITIQKHKSLFFKCNQLGIQFSNVYGSQMYKKLCELLWEHIPQGLSELQTW